MLQYFHELLFPLLIAIILALAAIAVPVLIFFVLRNRKQALIQSLPLLQTPAKAVEKSASSALQYTGKVWFRKPLFRVTFECPENKKKVFSVNRDNYCAIQEGEEGVLLFKQQGEKTYFIGFTKN